MKHLLIVALAPMLITCGHSPVKSVDPVGSRHIGQFGTVKPFANPTLIYGRDFLAFFSSLKLNYPGRLETLLTYTSKAPKTAHSLKAILNLYRHTNMNFLKKLRAATRMNDSTYILNYLAQTYATTSVITCTVAVEKDTCRIVLPKNLDQFLK